MRNDWFVQDRDLDFVPLPHDFEQLPHADQEVYPPLTIRCKTILFFNKSFIKKSFKSICYCYINIHLIIFLNLKNLSEK